MRRWSWFWFLLSGALLLLAVQVVITFNDLTCWKLTLLATEYGHRIALVALLLAWVCWRSGSRSLRLLAWFNGIAAIVLLFPLLQAWSLSRQLPEKLQAALGGVARKSAAPLHPASLWLGNWRPNATPENLEYVHDGPESRVMAFYRAQNTPAAPCVIVIHGGSWQSGKYDEFPDWSTYWASRGYAVAAVQYRLAPQHPWPAQREDLRLALAFLKSNATKLGVDPTRFILLGRSAGGQIAVACAYELEDSAIRGCISLYGPMDLVFARTFAKDTDVLDSLRLLRGYLGGDPAQAASAYYSSSPYLSASNRACPTLLVHGARDVLVWNMQSRRMAARLQDLGVPHYLLELPLGVHGLDWAFDGVDGQLVRYAEDQFMDTVCQGAGRPQ